MKRPRDEFAARRRRIARLAAKRPLGLEVETSPAPQQLDRLAEVLLDLVDEAERSGGS